MLRRLLSVLLGLHVCLAVAGDPGKPNLSQLQAVLEGSKLDSVTPTPLRGLYEVVMGSQVLYLSEDGRFAIQGDMVDLSTRSNLTEVRRGALRLKAVEAVGESNMVVFVPSGPVKHTVTVFTDIDCGYCRKLHSEMAAYNQNGIKVRYLMYPRAGIDSESYRKAVAVWCADNRQDALTRAKRGENIPLKTCENPVKEQYELGVALGVKGTPSLILEDGEIIPGYVPPTQLAQILEEKEPPK
jgi:thiol:disulfide interchange protein DsbC